MDRGEAPHVLDVPAFVRDGAIIPFRVLEQFVGEQPSAPLTLTIWPGRDQTYSLYQDDGHSTRYDTQGEFRQTEISTVTANGVRTVRVRRMQDSFVPKEDYFLIQLLGVNNGPTSVTAGNVNLNPSASIVDLGNAQQNSYFFDAPNGALNVKILDLAADISGKSQSRGGYRRQARKWSLLRS